jgi:hypothetical protein
VEVAIFYVAEILQALPLIANVLHPRAPFTGGAVAAVVLPATTAAALAWACARRRQWVAAAEALG